MGNRVVCYEAIKVAHDFSANTVFRRRGKACYYFDDDHICRIREATDDEMQSRVLYYSVCCDIYWIGKVAGKNEWHNNRRLDRMIASKIREGQKLEDILPVLMKECQITLHRDNSSQLDQDEIAFTRYFYVKKPRFDGLMGSLYEFISVEVSLTSDVTKAIVEKYRQPLDALVLDTIRTSKTFARMDVPMSLYELDRLTMTSDASLIYVFQLKEKYIEEKEH